MAVCLPKLERMKDRGEELTKESAVVVSDRGAARARKGVLLT